MTIKIESVINQWNSETDQVIVRFLNLLTLAKTRRELEQALDFSPFTFQGAVLETSVMGMGKPSPLGKTALPLQRQRSREPVTDS